MCDRTTCSLPCGTQDFTRYDRSVGTAEVFYPEVSPTADTQYGVMAHHTAQQWEVVAVTAGRIRHVAFISSVYCLEKVLGVARGIAQRPVALAH